MISIGYIIGTAIVAILVLACIAGIWAARRFGDADVFPVAAWTGGAIAVFVVGVWLASTWPSFDMDYHRYDPVSGVVEAVDKRLVSAGEGMSEKVVVRFTDNGGEYGCVDTRCALIEPGDVVELSCIRIYSLYGTDGFDCEFVARDDR